MVLLGAFINATVRIAWGVLMSRIQGCIRVDLRGEDDEGLAF